MAVVLAATAATGWLARVTVRDQNHRLLVERAGELRLVLTTDITAIPAGLGLLGQVLRASGGSVTTFTQAARNEVAAGNSPNSTFAWLSPAASGFIVTASSGPALPVGEIISDPRTDALNRALRVSGLTPTAIVGTGSNRTLGFAIGPPAAPPGTVLYRQDTLGPLAPPGQAHTQPFEELSVVLYATPTVDMTQVLVSTTRSLPLNHPVRLPVAAGNAHWLVSVAEHHPLVGSLTANAPWILAGTVRSARCSWPGWWRPPPAGATTPSPSTPRSTRSPRSSSAACCPSS